MLLVGWVEETHELLYVESQTLVEYQVDGGVGGVVDEEKRRDDKPHPFAVGDTVRKRGKHLPSGEGDQEDQGHRGELHKESDLTSRNHRKPSGSVPVDETDESRVPSSTLGLIVANGALTAYSPISEDQTCT